MNGKPNETPVHFRVEQCLYDELKKRVPGLAWFMSQNNPEADPPYACIQCDEARETTPRSGVFYVQAAILVTSVVDSETGGPEHAKRVQAVKKALDEMPRQGRDVENALDIHGVYLMRSTASNVEQEQGTLFELNVGCGVLTS